MSDRPNADLVALGRVVLLGHTGFIGRALAARLADAGIEVVGHSSASLDMRRREAFAVLDPVADHEATLVVASALTPDRGRSIDTLTDNVAMMANLARYLGDRPVRKCVYLSSDAVYPMTDQPVDEGSAVEPADFYALAKYAGERILRHAADAAGTPLLVIRPTAVFGPGDTHNSYGPNRFVRSAVEEGVVRLFGEGEETRDHILVDDMVNATLGLAASDATGVYNVATGTSRSFESIVEELQRLSDKPFEVVRQPRSGPVTHRTFDVARLRRAVPELRFTPFEEGLRATLEAARRGARTGRGAG
jgi:UDP-glucose 4-epimerase